MTSGAGVRARQSSRFYVGLAVLALLAPVLVAVPLTTTVAAFDSPAVASSRIEAGSGRDMAVLDGGGTTCGIDARDKALWCWGMNPGGQVGDGTREARVSPHLVQGALLGVPVRTVAANGGHTCAITEQSHLYCWGPNTQGGIGNGTTVDQPLPVRITGGGIGTRAVTAVDVRSHSTCAAVADVDVYCWGAGSNGRLGNASLTSSTTPVKINLTGTALAGRSIGFITVGSHMCAAAKGEPVRIACWGPGNTGQMGNGTKTTVNAMPVATTVTGMTGAIVQLETAGLTTCAVTTTGQAWCWGGNRHGSVANGTTAEVHVPSPVRITAPTPAASTLWAAVGTSPNHTCLISSAGEAWCAGEGIHGQLGDGGTTSSTTLRKVSTAGVLAGQDLVSISGASGPPGATCALAQSGMVFCWGGLGGTGLGDGRSDGSATPVRVQRPW